MEHLPITTVFFSNALNLFAVANVGFLNSTQATFATDTANWTGFNKVSDDGSVTDSNTYTQLSSALELNGENQTDPGPTIFSGSSAVVSAQAKVSNTNLTSVEVSKLAGVRVHPLTITGSAVTVDDYAGVRVEADSTASTVTNKYGLYVGAQQPPPPQPAMVSMRLGSSSNGNFFGSPDCSSLHSCLDSPLPLPLLVLLHSRLPQLKPKYLLALLLRP